MDTASHSAAKRVIKELDYAIPKQKALEGRLKLLLAADVYISV